MSNSSEVFRQFTKEMEDAGFDVEQYDGRDFYKGPAVNCDDSEERSNALAATRVSCTWDGMGLGYVVYPRV